MDKPLQQRRIMIKTVQRVTFADHPNPALDLSQWRENIIRKYHPRMLRDFLSQPPPFNDLEIELMEAGKMLLLRPSSVQELLTVLERIAQILSGVKQSPSESMKSAMQPSIEALIAKELVTHPDMDVKISVACCICEILRIKAPDAPYSDERMKEFFQLAVITLEKLTSVSGSCYAKLATVLETFSNIRLSVIMLDLELDELILKMFQHFFNAAGSDCSAFVPEMEKIMTMIIEESEQLTHELISLLLRSVRKDNQIASPLCWLLGEKVIKNYAAQLKPHLPDVVKHMGVALHDYSEIIAHICIEGSENVNTELKELAPDCDSSRETNASAHDYSNSLIKYTAKALTGHQQATEHLRGIDSQDANQILNSETGRKKRKIKPNPLINKTEGYDYTGKVFLTRGWRKHEKKILSSSDDPPMPSISETGVSGKRKRAYTLTKKEALKMAQAGVEHGENLVGRRVRVWWPMDKMYYEGVVNSFDHITKKHKAYYTDGDEENLNLKEEQWELIELPDSGESATPSLQANRNPQLAITLPIKAPSSQSEIINVHGYNVKANTAPILESIFAKYGDIAAKCIFKTPCVRASFLEVVSNIAKRIQTDDLATMVHEIDTMECEVSEAEAANVEVSWLRPHMEKLQEAMKRCSLLMDTRANAMVLNRAAKKDLRERHQKLVAAQNRFEEAERCVKALELVEKKLNFSILESKAQVRSWTKPSIV